MTYCAWMAAFTETVESRNPAGTATGLAIWGWIIRITVTFALLALTFVVSSTSTLVDKGPTALAIQAKYPKQVATLQALDPATAAALNKNAADPVALPKALAEVAKAEGRTTAEATAVKLAATKRFAELQTASAIDPTTLAALSAGSTAAPLVAKAQGEIAAKFNISQSAALTKLLALAAPATKKDLALVTPYATALQSATTIPKADLAYLNAYGTKIAKAQAQSPHQWQRWWWICFIAQVVFLPFVFLLKGRWSPKKAKQDEQDARGDGRARARRHEGHRLTVAPSYEGKGLADVRIEPSPSFVRRTS